MTTSRSTSTFRRTLTAALVVAICALLGTAHPAGALPIGTGGNTGPQNPAPVAQFTISPNPAFVSTQPVFQARSLVSGAASTALYGNGDLVTVSASATDADGIASYEWDLDGDGTFETGPTTKVRSLHYFRTGTITVRLRVTDNAGQSTVVSHVLVVHRAPKAGIGSQQAPVGVIGEQFKLYPQGSSGDPGIARYEWDVTGDGVTDITTSSNGPVPAVFHTLGQHTVHLKVVDTLGASATASLTLTIQPKPTAAFTSAPNPAVVGETVHFDASGSTDDGSIVDYQWDLDGDGQFETDTHGVPTVTMAYPTARRIDVSVLVIDNQGAGDVATHELIVNPIVVNTLPDRVAHAVKLTPKPGPAGTLVVGVTCPKIERACTGRVTAAGASGTFALSAGRSTTVRLHLSAAARKHRSSIKTTATTTDAAGNTAKSSATVKI